MRQHDLLWGEMDGEGRGGGTEGVEEKRRGENWKRLTDIGISEHEEKRQFSQHIFVGIERVWEGGGSEGERERDGRGRETKRDRDKETEAERDRVREIERQTKTWTDRTDRPIDRDRGTNRDRPTNRQRERQRHTETDRDREGKSLKQARVL